MRCGFVLLSLILLPVLTCAEDAPPKPLTPAAAAKKVREKVTVEMLVKSTGGGENCYLNSEEDFKLDSNFTIFIPKDTKEKLKKAGIEDPYDYYLDKTIQVTGTVILFEQKKPRIAVIEVEQIKVVEVKK
jgi:hypothetical protein